MVKAKESLLDYYVPAGHGDMSAKISQILNMRYGFNKALVAFDKNQFQINMAIKWFNTTELSIMQPENLSIVQNYGIIFHLTLTSGYVSYHGVMSVM